MSSSSVVARAGLRPLLLNRVRMQTVHCLVLGRSALHDEAEWLKNCESQSDIQLALRQRDPSLATPKLLQEASRRVLAQREVRASIAAITKRGGRAMYVSADVADAQAVSTTLARVQDEHGPITGIIHGAGVLADKFIRDISSEEFQRVFTTKVEGLKNILNACGKQLHSLVCFSSTTARLGRTGQVAYAMANEVLNKSCQQLASERGLRCISANWGPWDGGMVDPSLAKLFASEGIGLIPLRAGADWLAKEINRDGPEIVVLRW